MKDRVCPPHFRDARPGAAPELAQVIKQIDGHVASQDLQAARRSKSRGRSHGLVATADWARDFER